MRIGETYRRKGDAGAAIQSLQKARETLPDNIVVLSTLALVLDSAQRKPEAKQAYEATLKLDPNNAVALNNLAFLLAETGGDLDDALTKAQRAKQMMPSLHEISDTLGLDLPEEEPGGPGHRCLQRSGQQTAEPFHISLPFGNGLQPEGR